MTPYDTTVRGMRERLAQAARRYGPIGPTAALLAPPPKTPTPPVVRVSRLKRGRLWPATTVVPRTTRDAFHAKIATTAHAAVTRRLRSIEAGVLLARRTPFAARDTEMKINLTPPARALAMKLAAHHNVSLSTFLWWVIEDIVSE